MDRKIIKVLGLDSETFLQNLITNDIALTKEKPIYCCLLTPKGRYQYDFFLIKIEDYFLIDIYHIFAEGLIQLLNYRKLMARVTITIQNNLNVYLSKVPVQEEGIISYIDPRLLELGYRLICQDFSGEIVAKEDYNKLRFQYVIPEGADFIATKTIPIEYGMDELNAISYNKGCYLGQEFTMSAKHRLQIRKRLVGAYSTEPLAVGNIITNINNEEVGEVMAVLDKQSMILFKMKHLNDQLFYNNIVVNIHVPEWMKIYSLD